MTKYFIFMAICAFVSFISAIQIGSYAAEKKSQLRTMWWILTFAAGLAAVYFLILVSKTAN